MIRVMKSIIFLGDSLQNIRSFPEDARQDMGRQLLLVQRGDLPCDWKPMKTVGKGVKEIRVRVQAGAFRTVYIATLKDAVYVLHAFQKKTQQTRQQDIDVAARRLAELRAEL